MLDATYYTLCVSRQFIYCYFLWGGSIGKQLVCSCLQDNQSERQNLQQSWEYSDGTYTFEITATNEPGNNRPDCSGGNWAAVIYGVVQQRPDVCCENTGSYYNASTCECYPCSNLFDMGCLNCTLTSCTKCNAATNFVLSGTTCVCKSDMFVLNTLNVSQCVVCSVFLDNCTNCADKDTCTKCQVGYKLNPTTFKCEKCQVGCLSCDYNECFICDTSKQFELLDLSCVCNETSAVFIDQCRLCSIMIQNCTSCINGTTCTLCQDQNMITNSGLCESCPLNCSSCQLTQGCTSCHKGYHLYLSKCESLCGDGIYMPLENQQCDDGNLNDEDGCSSDCKVQQNFTCARAQKQLSKCSYSGSFRLFVKWVKKEYYQNKITLSIGIRPILKQLNLVNFTVSIMMNNSLKDCDYLYEENESLYLFYNFTETLEGHYALLTFSPSFSNSLFQLTPPSTLLIQLTTNSNIPITFYNPTLEYSPAQMMKKVLIFGISVSYFLLVASLITNRVASVQLFLVWQVSFLSVAAVDKVQPILSGLFSMEGVNGYNWMPVVDDRNVPDRINSIRYQGGMFTNINFNLILLLLGGVIIPFGIYACSFIFKKFQAKIKSAAKYFVKQCFFYLVLFQSMNIGFSAGLQILYGEWNIINSATMIILLCIVFFSFIAFNNTDSTHYGHFYSLLKQSHNSQIYFSINLGYRLIVGFIIAVLNYSPHAVLYVMFLSISFLIYQLSVRPFIIGYQNYQSIFCQFSTVIILGIRVFYRSFKYKYPVSIISKVLAPSYLEITFLLICMGITTAILSYEIINKYWKRKDGKEEKADSQSKIDRIEYTLKNINDHDQPVIELEDHA